VKIRGRPDNDKWGCVADRSTLKRCHFAVEFARQLPVEGLSNVYVCEAFLVDTVYYIHLV